MLRRPFDEKLIRLFQSQMAAANKPQHQILCLAKLEGTVPPFCFGPRLAVLKPSYQIAIEGNCQHRTFPASQSTSRTQFGKKRHLCEISDTFQLERSSSDRCLDCGTLRRPDDFHQHLIEQQGRRPQPAQQSDMPDLTKFRRIEVSRTKAV